MSHHLAGLEPADQRRHEPAPTSPIDPAFVFDFQPIDGPDDPTAAGTGRRWSTYWEVERLCRGPEPLPGWVVTDRAAIDTELGILKTGKEADVFVVERAVEAPSGPSSVMAAKRYRAEEHRSFHRSSTYTEGRRTRNTRDARAMAKKTRHGRAVAAGQWAMAEWEALTRFWSLGVPVPYPVQIDGSELLMELVTVDGEVAPRLAQTRPDAALLASYFDQLRQAMAVLARNGVAHGDLSPYNVLAAGDRIVVIDLPQAVDLVGNPAGPDFLMRDCHNVCTWFLSRGLDERLADEHALFGDLLAAAL
ncbi:MAG: serine protein kinase RIO [Nocardioidaceae bacterium]